MNFSMVYRTIGAITSLFRTMGSFPSVICLQRIPVRNSGITVFGLNVCPFYLSARSILAIVRILSLNGKRI